MRAARLTRWLLLGASVAACGGRLVSTTEGDGDQGGWGAGARSSGGNSSSGGSRNGGGAAGVGGAGPVGGAGSTAGTSAFGGGGNCPVPVCPPGIPIVYRKDGCGVCTSYCIEPVACPPVACGSGSHLETLPGECCPTCVSDGCAKQHEAYRELRAQLLEKYGSLGCMTDADCTVYYEKNSCEIGCGLVVPNAAVGYLGPNLESFAAQTCTPDCEAMVLPCEPAGDVFCIAGRCQ